MSEPPFRLSTSYEFQLMLMVITGMVLSLLPSHTQIWACLGLILFVGLPHGATDAFLIWETHRDSLGRTVLGLALYLTALIACLYVWLAATEIFWGLFFAAAVIHFGFGDEPEQEKIFARERKPLPRAGDFSAKLFRGCAIVLTPFIFHFDETRPYLLTASSQAFCNLLNGVALPTFTFAGLMCLGLVILVWWRRGALTHSLVKILLETAYYALLFAVVPPLLAFTLYFVCHHSLSHMLRIWHYKRNMTLFICTILCSLPIIALTLYFAPHSTTEAPVITTAAALTWIACLTFPHMYIVHTFPFHKTSAPT